jgi:hypothetical protein
MSFMKIAVEKCIRYLWNATEISPLLSTFVSNLSRIRTQDIRKTAMSDGEYIENR